MLYNAVLGFFRSRIESVVGSVVNDKGLYNHPWRGSMALLKALMTIDVHATQLQRNSFGVGRRLVQVSGPYPQR